MIYALTKIFNERLGIHFPSLIEIENCKIEYPEYEYGYSEIYISCTTKRVLYNSSNDDDSIIIASTLYISENTDLQDFIITAPTDASAFNYFYEIIMNMLETYLGISVNKENERENKYNEVKLFLEILKNKQNFKRKDFKNIILKKKNERRLNDFNR